jgi:hypothetical protein
MQAARRPLGNLASGSMTDRAGVFPSFPDMPVGTGIRSWWTCHDPAFLAGLDDR